MPRHENNVQRPKTRQVRPKADDFFDVSEPEGAARAHSTAARPQTPHEESDDDDTNIDSDRDEKDLDAPRVAQWVDDEDFELQEQTDDASGSEEEEDDEDHSASEPGPSRTLVSTSSTIQPNPCAKTHG